MVLLTPCLYALGCSAELRVAVVDVNARLGMADRTGDERRVASARYRVDCLNSILYVFLGGVCVRNDVYSG